MLPALLNGWRDLGHPGIGDDFGDDFGAGPARALWQRAQMARRRQMIQRQQAMQGDDLGWGFMADDFGGDESDLDDVEAEIDAVGDDFGDEEASADSAEEIGAAGTMAARRARRLSDRITSLRAMQAAAPPGSRRARRAAKLIGKAERKRDKKMAKVAKHQRKLAAILGVPVAAMAAGAMAGGVSADSGYAAEQWMQQAQGMAAMGVQGFMGRSNPEGQEMRLAFNDVATGQQVSRFTIPPGGGLQLVPLSLVTPIISFASFRVIGIDINFQARQLLTGAFINPNQLLLNLLLNNLTVNGDINLVVAPVDALATSQVVNGSLSCARTIAGFRENPVLDRTNQTTTALTVRQEIATTTTIEGSLTASLVVQRVRDPAAERKPV
jgi:hypothetical protein